jgi:hypothetical protein
VCGKQNASGGRCVVFIPVGGVVGTCGAALRKVLAGWLRRLSVFLFFVAAEDRIKNF